MQACHAGFFWLCGIFFGCGCVSVLQLGLGLRKEREIGRRKNDHRLEKVGGAAGLKKRVVEPALSHYYG